MTDNYKVSIIVPVYKVERYIERCLCSVISQTYQGELECILVDDCTPDQSMEIVKRILSTYSGNISFKIVRHEQNRGLSAARNTGVKNASGEYLYFLDSDDEITPDAMEKLITLADKYDGIELIFANLYASEQMKFLFIREKIEEYFSDHVEIKRMMLEKKELPVTAWNKLIKKSFFIEYELWFAEGLLHEDELWNYFAAKYATSLAITDKPTYVYYINDNSIMKNYSWSRVECLLKIAEIMITHIDDELSHLQRRLAIEMGYSALTVWENLPDKRKGIYRQLRELYSPMRSKALCRFRFLELMVLLPFFLGETYGLLYWSKFKRYHYFINRFT